MNVDPSGHFVIAIGSIITAALITAGIGAGLAVGTVVLQDLENGILFDGDVSFSHYIGSFLGGLFAGFGVGLCGALGAGIGASIVGVATLGIKISGLAALGIGLASAASSGAIGYLLRIWISDQETFNWSHLFIETGTNILNGALSFLGGFIGGSLGLNVPGNNFSKKTKILNFIGNQLLQLTIGVYAMKVTLSKFKKTLKELFP